MIFEGRAVVIREDNVDTDVLYPGPYLNIDDPSKMKNYLFEGLDPSLRECLGGATILVVGENFGAGSSREHVPLAMKAWGIRAVVGKSFARIFYRNCINLGFPAVVCPTGADSAHGDSRVALRPEHGEVDVDGATYRASPMPPFILEMIRAGGLVAWVRGRLGQAASWS